MLAYNKGAKNILLAAGADVDGSQVYLLNMETKRIDQQVFFQPEKESLYIIPNNFVNKSIWFFSSEDDSDENAEVYEVTSDPKKTFKKRFVAATDPYELAGELRYLCLSVGGGHREIYIDAESDVPALQVRYHEPNHPAIGRTLDEFSEVKVSYPLLL